ncbi:MAG: 23S rRNA (adenine(2503)-C(2))-methyltransferase RlmN [Anaerolineae bacterium]|nr:23S rRNA (adenine(2503)-C(2))-methyltransferase RlmN [Anaerolineae bacterium]
MHNLLELDRDGLTRILEQWGQPSFRARQILTWVYQRHVTDFADMTDLPLDLRERLVAEMKTGSLSLAHERRSRDGTLKRVYRLDDGQLIETVLMHYRDRRRSACISTQAGCALGWIFCATGEMGFVRHLSAAEIVEQALLLAQELTGRGERLSNVVLMGMGEPFHNYDESLKAVRRLMDDLGIGARHITISTVGLVPQIRRFADEGLQVRLAVSLHAATNADRSALLPVNRRWPLRELMAACRDYVRKTGRRITFEWALIRGETDTMEQAHALGKLLQGLLCHVNAIPLNPTADYAGSPSSSDEVERFLSILADYGVRATVRVRRGIDIDAGCGQLRAAVQAKEADSDAL